MKVILLFILIAITQATFAGEKVYKWENKSGSVIQANFLSSNEDSVTISKNGRKYSIKFDNLSAQSVRLAKELGAQKKTREYLCAELNKQLPIRLDSSSTLFKATVKSGSLVYFVKVNIQEFVRLGNSIGQPIPSTNTLKQFFYKQTWNQWKRDPSYGPAKKVFDSAKYFYINERNQKLFDFTIEF